MTNVNITNREYEQLVKLASDLIGIRLINKQSLVQGRLRARLTALKIKSFDEYYQYISNPRNHDELDIFIEKITTHETKFFREPAHFELLANQILPELRKKNNHLNIWCAACSTGEEFYSLAIQIQESSDFANVELLGTDISKSCIESAKQALYKNTACEEVSTEILKKYFLKGTGRFSGTSKVKLDCFGSISYMKHNLLDKLENNKKFDIIFCRNVLIYFDESVKRQVVENLCQKLTFGGYLFIGSSENIRELLPQGMHVITSSVAQKCGKYDEVT